MTEIKDYFLAMYLKLTNVLRSEKGQTLVEYALILVLIALVVIAALTVTGQKVSSTFSNINNALK